ncbi:MAG: hypothetical protein V7752_02515 [Halopseudomonas sp.]
MKLILFTLCVLISSGVWAQVEETTVPQQAPSQPQDPVIEQLQSLQSMRMRLEQDWSNYLNAARSNTGAQPMQPATAAGVGQMRQEVTHNLERMEDRFRCLDVDLNGNNGNVVLVCGDNNGGIATTNQQALGADLNIGGGGL